MAQRFGGKFSPDGKPAPDKGPPGPGNVFDGKRPARVGMRVNLLFAAPMLFLVPAFWGGPQGLVLGLAAGAILLLSAWLTREGVLAQEAYDARRVARRPAIPRKIFAAVLMGVGLTVGAMTSQDGLVYPILFGLIGAALHLFTFGPDPLRDKGSEGVDQFQTDRVARAVDGAEKQLAAMQDAILRARDRQIEARVERFSATARALFRTVENDPRDLTAARKYLSVYLLGAKDATVKFADLYAQNRDPKARTEYEALLDDLESTFATRTRTLLTDNRTDLDVEIQVLRERLQRET